jgi:hypothetical protein
MRMNLLRKKEGDLRREAEGGRRKEKNRLMRN